MLEWENKENIMNEYPTLECVTPATAESHNTSCGPCGPCNPQSGGCNPDPCKPIHNPCDPNR